MNTIEIKESDLENHKGDIFIQISETKIISNINLNHTQPIHNSDDKSSPDFIWKSTKQIKILTHDDSQKTPF